MIFHRGKTRRNWLVDSRVSSVLYYYIFMGKSSSLQNRVCKACREHTDANRMRCQQCGAWEFANTAEVSNGVDAKRVVYMNDYRKGGVSIKPLRRIETGPWDSTLGGGLVPGNTVILAGQAGGGKSTLSLQIVAKFPEESMYVSREETLDAVCARADRLKVKKNFGIIPLLECPEIDVESVLYQTKPKLVIFDSLQKYSGGDDRVEIETCEWLKRYAVRHDACVIIINHVNKDTVVAGAYALQHEVDVVECLFPNDDKTNEIYSIKSRQGPTFDVVLLKMTARGLVAAKVKKSR